MAPLALRLVFAKETLTMTDINPTSGTVWLARTLMAPLTVIERSVPRIGSVLDNVKPSNLVQATNV
jgi:hypothetical protein